MCQMNRSTLYFVMTVDANFGKKAHKAMNLSFLVAYSLLDYRVWGMFCRYGRGLLVIVEDKHRAI